MHAHAETCNVVRQERTGDFYLRCVAKTICRMQRNAGYLIRDLRPGAGPQMGLCACVSACIWFCTAPHWFVTSAECSLSQKMNPRAFCPVRSLLGDCHRRLQPGATDPGHVAADCDGGLFHYHKSFDSFGLVRDAFLRRPGCGCGLRHCFLQCQCVWD